MFDELDYRYAVSGITTDKSKKVMSDLRLEIFMAAAKSENAEACLMPFPPCFFDGNQKRKDFELLRKTIALIPPLSELTEDTELPSLTWELLYWILTNPLTIQHVPTSPEMLKAWETETGRHLKLLTPYERLFLFKVNNPYPKPAFVEGKSKYGSFFTFHGSQFQNYHSIIHRGILNVLCRDGAYLASSYSISQKYTQIVPAWTGSAFDGMLHCVSICEVIDEPSVLKGDYSSEGLQYVVRKDELMQLSHILLRVTPRIQNHYEAYNEFAINSVLERFRT